MLIGSLHDHLRDIPWDYIFKLGAFSASTGFCKQAQVGIDVYNPNGTYQVKPHSYPWFSAASAAAIAHRNHLFHFYQQNKSSATKMKFRQASNPCKRNLEAPKLV